MLHASIVYKDINSSKLFQSFFDYLFTVCWFCQISKNKEGCGIGVFSLELIDSVFNFLFRGKSIEDDVVALGS